jgi:hypothetical protein
MRARMKLIHSLILAAALISVPAAFLQARVFHMPSDEELLAKSDLVVVATPTATHETKDRVADFFNFHAEAVGVETTFAVSAVVKGDPATKELILYHYWGRASAVPNGAMLVSFDPAKKEVFRLYLIRLANGRYAPAAGQMDAALSIKKEK